MIGATWLGNDLADFVIDFSDIVWVWQQEEFVIKREQPANEIGPVGCFDVFCMGTNSITQPLSQGWCSLTWDHRGHYSFQFNTFVWNVIFLYSPAVPSFRVILHDVLSILEMKVLLFLETLLFQSVGICYPQCMSLLHVTCTNSS